MAKVITTTFNPFQENTYIVIDEATRECAIFDPGCYDAGEKEELTQIIERENAKPVKLINTHCHIDHVFGNKFVSETYKLGLEIHKGEIPVLEAVPQVAMFYGIPLPDRSPAPVNYIEEGDIIQVGKTQLKAILTPGHSPASLSFYCEEGKFVIAGDALFKGSIGRTDLPGGNYDTLIESIQNKLLTLPSDTVVYSGHGPATTIGEEAKTNPFLT